jgi:ditrans,polycis-polyprenyl diphosphate synthase
MDAVERLALACMLAAAILHWLVRRRGSEFVARRILLALRVGGPPRSVAFVMDGNRRWARARGKAPYDGHPRGGEKLADALQWCLDAGVMTVTVYAFSIENFKRPKREVDEIFALAHDRFSAMLDETDLIKRHRVRVNVLGDLHLLPPKLRAVFARAMRETRAFADTGGPVLNVCFAYTARAEIAHAVSTAVRLCDSGRLSPDDIDEPVLAACLYTGYACGASHHGSAVEHPDLLVRTSGETRLSDFLLWQSSNSIISFESVLWPDLTAWHMIRIILDFQIQRRARYISLLRCDSCLCTPPALQGPSLFGSQRVQAALDSARRDFFASIDCDTELTFK